MSSKPHPLIERILWHVPNVGRLKLERNLETNELSHIFEIEYLTQEQDFRTTAFSRLDNPEMTTEFLQEFITHTLEQWTKRQNCNLSPEWFIQHLEQALDLMFAELARRADGLKI